MPSLSKTKVVASCCMTRQRTISYGSNTSIRQGEALLLQRCEASGLEGGRPLCEMLRQDKQQVLVEEDDTRCLCRMELVLMA